MITLNSAERRTIFVALLALAGFIATRMLHDSLYVVYNPANYLALHTLLEFFSVMVSFSIVLQGWLIFPHTLSSRRLQLGAAFLAVGLLDLLHTLTYQGMPFFFTASLISTSIWFWITARLTEAFALWAIFSRADLTVNSEKRGAIFLLALAYVLIISMVIIGRSGDLPVLVDEGKGVTNLKIGLEYVVSFLHLLTIGLLLNHYRRDKQRANLTLVLASVFLLLGGMVFTLYQQLYDFDNLLGHIYKVLGYFFLMKGIYFSTIEEPFLAKQRAEAALLEAEAKYRTLVEESLAGVYLIQNERYIYINPRFAEIFGYKQGELIEKPYLILVAEDDRPVVIEKIRQRTSGEVKHIRYMFRGIRKDGRLIDLEVHGTRIIYNQSPAVLGTLLDITEQKRTEELLRKADKLSVVGQLAAGVAHEVRNPLTVLRGFIQMLRGKAEQNKEYFDLMLSETERIESIISEFLVLAKPQMAKLQQQDLCKLLQNIITLVETRAIMNNIRILTEYEPDIPLVNCDANQLKQVFINILKNAIEAMPGGGEITIKIMTVDRDKVLIRFTDQGEGIPEERLHRLGEPFFTTKEKGTGLGLMVSYRIIHNHSGNIYITSKPNEGTTFDITIPATTAT